jgi:hypothetical protein
MDEPLAAGTDHKKLEVVADTLTRLWTHTLRCGAK